MAALTEEARAIWDRLADFWDERAGEGNRTQRVLIGPATERLLDVQPGERVLDVGCGNGAFARRLAELGAQVVAIDFSERFLERARARTTKHGDRIDYRLVDATDEAQLLALGEQRFDAAVSTMTLMDVATVWPLAAALKRVLKPGGRFVFSVLHPCFNSSEGVKLVAELEDRGGEIATVYSVKVSSYIRPSTWRGAGIAGQPAAQLYFHRPLGELLQPFFSAGFSLDGLEEPVAEARADASKPIGWGRFTEIPAALVARLRLAQGSLQG